MPSPEPPKASVNHVLALSEEELVQFMKQNLGPDGAFDLPIEGWDTLQEDQRDQLAEKLRFGAQKVNETVRSRPVDFAQVAARLEAIPDGQDALPHSPSRFSRHDREPTEEVDFEEQARHYETWAYNELVKDGGRPAYSINLLDQISHNPEEYRELLQPWQPFPYIINPPLWKDVLSTQLSKWWDFRYWQKETRGIFNNDAEYLAHVETEKRLWEWAGETKVLSEMEADPSASKSAWSWMERIRLRDYWYLRKNHGRGGFPEYIEEVKDCLAQHGFTQTVQLEEDPRQQDRLTTWIEYLNYEYSWYDRYSRNFKNLQPKYDEAWQELVDSGVLGPSETDEYLRTMEASIRRQSEIDQAEAEVESARSASGAVLLATQKEPQRSRLAKPVRIQMMKRAHARLRSAYQSRAATKKRCDLIANFILGTRWFINQRASATNQSIRLQWILEQIPQIAAKLDPIEAVERTSDVQSGTKRRRERDQDDEAPLGRKRTKLGHDNVMVGSIREAKRKLQLSHGSDQGDERPSKKPRMDSCEPEFQHQARGDVDAAFITALQAVEVPAAKRRSGNGNAVLDVSEVSSNSLPQSTNRPPLPSIETAKSRSNGLKERKRGLEHDQDEIGQAQNHKRQKRNAPDKGSYEDTAGNEPLSDQHMNGCQLHDSYIQTSNEADAATVGKRKTSTRNVPQSSITLQPLRRSARIAARQEAGQNDLTRSRSSRRRMAPVAAPPSPTRLQDQQSRVLATKARKQDAKRGRRRDKTKP